MGNIGPKEQALREQREAKFRGRNAAASTTTAQLRALQENVKMKTKTEKKPAAPKRKAPKARSAKTKPAASSAAKSNGDSDGAGGGESKVAMIAALLTSKDGCTAADILAATGWPTVSVPAQAKAAGLKLTKTKEGRTFRYRGTPLQAAA